MNFEINKNNVCINAPKIVIVDDKFMQVSISYAFNGEYWATGYDFNHKTPKYGFEGHGAGASFGNHNQIRYPSSENAINTRKQWIAESLKRSYEIYKDERFLPIIELLTPKQLQLF